MLQDICCLWDLPISRLSITSHSELRNMGLVEDYVRHVMLEAWKKKKERRCGGYRILFKISNEPKIIAADFWSNAREFDSGADR